MKANPPMEYNMIFFKFLNALGKKSKKGLRIITAKRNRTYHE